MVCEIIKREEDFLTVPLELNSGYRFNPPPKQLELLGAALYPDYGRTKILEALCGIGSGKSTAAIFIAYALMESDSRHRIMFIEPDKNRLDSVFWAEWEAIVPKYKYRVRKNRSEIVFHNGAVLYPRILWVTGNKEQRENAQRGPNLSVILHDEAALGFTMEYFHNCLGRLRVDTDVRMYGLFTTPKPGEYDEIDDIEEVIRFKCKTSDNEINLPPGWVEEMRRIMTPERAARELDAEKVALEGAIWKDFDGKKYHPYGNLDAEKFDDRYPYILAGDIGVKSAWLIIQQIGNRESQRDVIVGQYMPDNGCVKDDLSFIFKKYGQPAKVIWGSDDVTRNKVTGESARFELKRSLEEHGMRIVSMQSPDGIYTDKMVQYDALSTLIYHNRLTLSRDCIVDGNTRRDFLSVMKQDMWPVKGTNTFNKDKANGKGLEDCRDAALYYAVCMHPIRLFANQRSHHRTK